MTLLQTVRIATRSRHDTLENLIGSDRLKDFSIEDYKLLLSTNFLFHSHLEKAISLFLEQKILDDDTKQKLNFQKRIKTNTLKEELNKATSAESWGKLKNEENKISFASFSMLLGWLYVAEGSMLGGKMIHKILSQNENVNQWTDFDFYKNYENKTLPLWKSLKDLIEEKCITEKEKKEFLQGAENSYIYFEQVFFKAKMIYSN